MQKKPTSVLRDPTDIPHPLQDFHEYLLAYSQKTSRLPDFWASEAQFHVVKPLGPEFYLGQAALGTFSGSSLKIGTPVSH